MPSTPPQNLVLIGYGMVGHRFLEALAERDALPGPGRTTGRRVTVLAEEDVPAYDRVHLSSVFAGTPRGQLSLADSAFADRHGIDLRLGDPAVRIDTEARTVTTARGARLAYDALVLATGSSPFVPPVPGREATGCFTYRTLTDVDKLIAYVGEGGRHTGAVIGGGLLGLEAAGALRTLGLRTHVVEFAPRLMPLQVDDGGAAALRTTIESMGVTVHTGVSARGIDTDAEGRARGLLLSDGHRIDADVVVFSAGIRPRDRLARESGLAVDARGGVAVDAHCRTSDPRVFAVGECARTADGQVYGLVAPGYRMAETVADRLAGAASLTFTGADTSTKLKLMGADVASFGDPFAGETGEAAEVLFSDGREGVYKKLLLGPGGQLLGGILVGDAAPYDALKPHVGRELPAPAAAFVAPGGGEGTPGADALPDDTVVCSCHNVTKAAVKQAVAEHGLTDLDGIKRRTKAGTGCGGCAGSLQAVLDAELAAGGVEKPRGLCEHFALTRSEIYRVVRDERLCSFTELLAKHGTGGEGCAVCKPVVANVLGTLAPELGIGHVLDGEQAGLQDSGDLFLANLQKDGSYSVVPRVAGGEITAEQVIVLGEIARDHGLYTKITGAQRIGLFGARAEQLPGIWRRLRAAGFESGQAYGKSLRAVKSCVGSRFCRFGQGDSIQLAIDLELRYRGLRTPHKFKGGVSGCLRECAEAHSKDVGVIATAKGWNLYVCGNGGARPRHADLLATDLSTAELLKVVDRFLMYYVMTAERLERTAAWIQRIDGGLDHVKEVVLEDSLGICAELEAQMERHVAAYRDEWEAVLDDPAALSRFGHVDFGALDSLEPGRGRPVRLPGGGEAAVFKTAAGEVYAVSNRDPFSGADVIANGIMGSRDGVPVVASPMHKQVFDLRTGQCLDDPEVSLPLVAVEEARP
ncbi:nitrite reductase large subunit NirB [Streptomyces gamaensis]|uniref:assimilatory sulfite reductase (ferredoxin) n=1 Tax=Streptomyces gamaensis TaxID=1763542 RepID=A0ABW0Z2M5_9ACTN